MRIINFIHNLRRLIAKGELETSINDLITFLSKSPKLDDVIMQSARLSDLAKQVRNGTIRYDDINITKNQITKAVLELIREVEENLNKNEELRDEAERIEEFPSIIAPFGVWIKSEYGILYVRVISILVILFGLNLTAKVFDFQWFKEEFRLISISLQVVFITIVVFSSLHYRKFRNKRPDELSEKEIEYSKGLRLYRPTELSPQSENARLERWLDFKKAANKVSNQFSTWWQYIWLTWGCLYITFGLQVILGIFYDIRFSIAENFFNNLNTLFSIFLFLVLTISTSKLSKKYWMNWIIVIIILTVIECVLVEIYPGKEYYIEFWAKMISGLFGSVALMSIIGRLNSKYINIPVWLGFTLYCYAAIQPLYVFFYYHSLAPSIQTGETRFVVFEVEMSVFPYFVMFFTLLLKALFFLVVTWLLKTGRLLFFVMEESSLNFIRDENFKRFLGSIEFEDSSVE